MKTRFFKSGILNHCYQRSADHGLLFYSKSDYLVWFTVLCTVAPRHGVNILAVCPMPDHTHMAVPARFVRDLSRCIGEVNRTFSKLHNEVCNIKSSWFERPYGSAPQWGTGKDTDTGTDKASNTTRTSSLLPAGEVVHHGI